MCSRLRMLVCGLVLAVSIPGCGDPDRDRLEVGQRVMLIPGFRGDDGQPSPNLAVTAREEPIYRIVDAGTEARVVRDEGDVTKSGRDVVVRVAEGEHQGLTGTVMRFSCRPVK